MTRYTANFSTETKPDRKRYVWFSLVLIDLIEVITYLYVALCCLSRLQMIIVEFLSPYGLPVND
jgi:hypothetical protein